MTLSKQTFVDGIEVELNGTVKVRTKTVITENNLPISASYESHVILPGADYSAEDVRVQAICAAANTFGSI